MRQHAQSHAAPAAGVLSEAFTGAGKVALAFRFANALRLNAEHPVHAYKGYRKPLNVQAWQSWPSRACLRLTSACSTLCACLQGLQEAFGGAGLAVLAFLCSCGLPALLGILRTLISGGQSSHRSLPQFAVHRRHVVLRSGDGPHKPMVRCQSRPSHSSLEAFRLCPTAGNVAPFFLPLL